MAGISFSRWSTEATCMQEFRRYAHYMQPRIHHMIAEARSLAHPPAPLSARTFNCQLHHVQEQCADVLAA